MRNPYRPVPHAQEMRMRPRFAADDSIAEIRIYASPDASEIVVADDYKVLSKALIGSGILQLEIEDNYGGRRNYAINLDNGSVQEF